MRSLEIRQNPIERKGSVGTDQEAPLASERLTTLEKENIQGEIDEHNSSVGNLGDDEEEEEEIKENKKLLTSSSESAN